MDKDNFAMHLPEQLRRQVKAAAALEGKAMRVWVTEALEEKLERSKTAVNA
jgi:predicted HicB family RNase H-like nuclease